jgi:hypothetical protein
MTEPIFNIDPTLTEMDKALVNEEQFQSFADHELSDDDATPERLREQCRLVVVDGIKELQQILADDTQLTAIGIIASPEENPDLVRFHVAGDVLAIAVGLNMMMLSQGVSPVTLLGGIESIMRNFMVRSGQAPTIPDLSGDKNLSK